MSAQAGYTLAETLAALTVLALAVSGLTAGGQVLLRQQTIINSTVAKTQVARLAQLTLDQALNRSAPYRAQDPAHFSGESQALRIDCGQAADCTAAVTDGPGSATLTLNADGTQRTWRLGASGRTHFLYVGSLESGEVWPPASGRRQALLSVALVDEAAAGPATLLDTKLWAEQPAICAFDPVLQDCR